MLLAAHEILLMSQTRQLFGTDGIRGVAGEFPLSKQSTYLIGRALGHDLLRTTSSPQAVIGQDTRESSRWIADRVAEGLAAVGVEVHSAGVITTPGVAFLARSSKILLPPTIPRSRFPSPPFPAKRRCARPIFIRSRRMYPPICTNCGLWSIAPTAPQPRRRRNCFAASAYRQRSFTFRPTAKTSTTAAERCTRKQSGKRWPRLRENSTSA